MKRSNRFGLRRSWHRILRTGARPGGEEGAALYELAMVTPFLSMLLLGIIWGGITFYDYVVLADAVAAGARTLATGHQRTTLQRTKMPANWRKPPFSPRRITSIKRTSTCRYANAHGRRGLDVQIPGD